MAERCPTCGNSWEQETEPYVPERQRREYAAEDLETFKDLIRAGLDNIDSLPMVWPDGYTIIGQPQAIRAFGDGLDMLTVNVTGRTVNSHFGGSPSLYYAAMDELAQRLNPSPEVESEA